MAAIFRIADLRPGGAVRLHDRTPVGGGPADDPRVALAEAIGLTFQQVQKYKKGVNRVSSSRLVDLANALDVSIPYFLDEMSAAVQGQTPSELMRTKTRPENDQVQDPLARRETLELVRAY